MIRARGREYKVVLASSYIISMHTVLFNSPRHMCEYGQFHPLPAKDKDRYLMNTNTQCSRATPVRESNQRVVKRSRSPHPNCSHSAAQTLSHLSHDHICRNKADLLCSCPNPEIVVEELPRVKVELHRKLSPSRPH